MKNIKIKRIFEVSHVATQARWIYIALIVFIGIITKISGVPNISFSYSRMAVLFLVAVANNSFWYLSQFFSFGKNNWKERLIYKVTFFQYVVDIFIVTVIIHFAGGIESISFVFYFFVIVASGFIYGRREVLSLSLLAIFFYNFLVFAEYFGLIGTYPRYSFSNLEIHHFLDVVLVNTFTVSTVIFTTALFVSYLTGLRQKQEEKIVAEKNEKLREVKKTEEIRSRFVTVFTHQLRTPLTHIKLALASLFESKERLSEENRKLLLEASLSLERILTLLDRLVKLKDLETGKEDLVREAVSLNQVAKEAISALSLLSLKKQITVLFEKTGEMGDCVVAGDKNLLLEVVKIFLENAIIYGDAGSKVRVVVSKGRNFSEVSVINQGFGIFKQERSKIFSPFFRTEKAIKADTDRSGLSLYLAKIIAKKHRGKIFFSSLPNKETIFSLKIPVFRDS